MHIPDPIERIEAGIDRQVFEQTAGLPAGMFRCQCGKVISIDEGSTISAAPDAPFACWECCENAWMGSK